MMTADDISAAAALLWEHWRTGRRMLELPSRLRPRTSEEAYAIQEHLAGLAGDARPGWMLVGVSVASRTYVDVDRPFLGRILAGHMLPDGTEIDLARNHVRLAEAEFGFRMGRTLPPRRDPYSTAEVIAAVEAVHLTIEVPNSRFFDATTVGAHQLVADNSFGCQVVLGPAVDGWQRDQLATCRMKAIVVGRSVREGQGSRAMGDPCRALAFAVNELSRLGYPLAEGQVVLTGGLTYPIPIEPGDRVEMDFGRLGIVSARFV